MGPSTEGIIGVLAPPPPRKSSSNAAPRLPDGLILLRDDGLQLVRPLWLSLSPPLPQLANGAGEGLRELNSVLCSEFLRFSLSLCVPLVDGDGERELNSVQWCVFLLAIAECSSPLDRDGERELNSVL